MSEGPPNWLHTATREHRAVALQKTPVVFYPFGAQPESSLGDSDARGTSAPGRVSVEEPRVMHTRPSLSPHVDAAAEERNDTQDSAARSSPWTSRGPGPTEDPHPAPSAATPWNHPEIAIEPTPKAHAEPMPQAQALAQVRKHLLTRDSSTGNASPGRLAAERFTVGWIVYTPVAQGRSTNPIYYVADDGELEESSAAAERSAYLKSVEQRFWQRRALFG